MDTTNEDQQAAGPQAKPKHKFGGKTSTSFTSTNNPKGVPKEVQLAKEANKAIQEANEHEQKKLMLDLQRDIYKNILASLQTDYGSIDQLKAKLLDPLTPRAEREAISQWWKITKDQLDYIIPKATQKLDITSNESPLNIIIYRPDEKQDPEVHDITPVG